MVYFNGNINEGILVNNKLLSFSDLLLKFNKKINMKCNELKDKVKCSEQIKKLSLSEGSRLFESLEKFKSEFQQNRGIFKYSKSYDYLAELFNLIRYLVICIIKENIMCKINIVQNFRKANILTTFNEFIEEQKNWLILISMDYDNYISAKRSRIYIFLSGLFAREIKKFKEFLDDLQKIQ